MTLTSVARGNPEGVDRRKAWIGSAFMATLCADAGFAWAPTPGENDIHSLDGSIAFWSGQSTPVQVKGTGRFQRSKSYRIQQAWRKNWGQLVQPSYFVVVTVPPSVGSWTYHGQPKTTLLECAAYWARIDGLAPSLASVQVDVKGRLTIDVLNQWRDEAVTFAEEFGG